MAEASEIHGGVLEAIGAGPTGGRHEQKAMGALGHLQVRMLHKSRLDGWAPHNASTGVGTSDSNQASAAQ